MPNTPPAEVAISSFSLPGLFWMGLAVGVALGAIIALPIAFIWMRRQLDQMSSWVASRSSERLQSESQNQLRLLLDPLKERLQEFEKKVHDSYNVEQSERSNLRGELNKLFELSLKLSNETQNLGRLFKGDSKAQGLWGEMVLENILESCGLRKDHDFEVQKTGTNSDGISIRPDVIVHMPNQKFVVIDSKVSLRSFEAYLQATVETDKLMHAKAHCDSIKTHIEGLAGKKYSSFNDATLELVLLFVPLEAAFNLAFQYRPELLQLAWDKGIAIVSPTTLMSNLKTVAHLWRHDLQEKNALEIAQRGGALYDKFVGFVQDLQTVKDRMSTAQKSLDSALAKLHEGPGNLASQVQKLKDLGAKSEKRL